MKEEEDEALVKRLEALEKRVSEIEARTGGTAHINMQATSLSKNLSIGEFLLEKKPTDSVKMTLAVAYYLEKYENLTSMNRKELEAAIRRAKEKVPANLNDKVNLAIKGGYLQEASEKKNNLKAWTVTRTGETYVENNFNLK